MRTDAYSECLIIRYLQLNMQLISFLYGSSDAPPQFPKNLALLGQVSYRQISYKKQTSVISFGGEGLSNNGLIQSLI